MKGLLGWLVGHARWVVTAVVVVSVGLGLAAMRLSLEFHAGDLLPQGHPFIAVHNRYHRNFSEANTLTVMVEAREGTIFTVPLLTTIFRLTDVVDGLPAVNHDQVTSVAHRMTRWARVRAGGLIESDPIMLGPPQSQDEVDEIRHEVIQSYAFSSMVSLDQRAAIIRAGFDERRLDYRTLFDAVNARVLPFADEHAAIYVSGQPRLNGWILHLQGQVLIAFVAAIVLTWLSLYAYFRDMGQIWAVIVLALFWLTPIVFDVEALPGAISNLVYFNPLTRIMGLMRHYLIYSYFDLRFLLMTILYSVLSFVVGYLVFRRHSEKLAEMF